jgi:L-lactate dehydrogenase (cytochrome)
LEASEGQEAGVEREATLSRGGADDPRPTPHRGTLRAAFHYTDGAAEAEISLGRDASEFEDIEFSPRGLRLTLGIDASGARATR